MMPKPMNVEILPTSLTSASEREQVNPNDPAAELLRVTQGEDLLLRFRSKRRRTHKMLNDNKDTV